MAWWFMFVGVVLLAMGVTQAVVGTDRIVGQRWTFDDFSIRGRPIEPRRVVQLLASSEIGAGLAALAIAIAVA